MAKPADFLPDVPRRPSHISEWEDLLIRFEVGPQAVRHTLDGAEGDDAGMPAERRLSVPLAALAAAEAVLAAQLWNMRTGEPPRPAAGDAHPAGEVLLDRYARLRARNFVMVQRRGLDVWDWSWKAPGGDVRSAFQLLAGAVRRDVEQLARLRGLLRERAAC